MDYILTPGQFVLIPVLCILAYTDIRFRIIPNRIVYPGAVLIAAADLMYLPRADASIAWQLAFIALLLVLFSMRLMGGGDIKIYILLTLAYPNKTGLMITVVSVLAAGALSLAKRLRCGGLALISFNIRRLCTGNLMSGAGFSPEQCSKSDSVPMAFCLAVSASAVSAARYLKAI